MRAVTKILQARASEHPCNFCEQFEQRPNFASTFELNGTIRYPIWINVITSMILFKCWCFWHRTVIGDTFQIELEFRSVGFSGEGKTGVPREKPLGARMRTNNKLNPHYDAKSGN